jgi:hypothetical protein
MRQFIQNCIDSRLSFNDVELMFHRGHIGQRQWEAFCRVWEWSGYLFGGTPGMRQDAFWKKHGAAAFNRKINRTRAAFGIKPV